MLKLALCVLCAFTLAYAYPYGGNYWDWGYGTGGYGGYGNYYGNYYGNPYYGGYWDPYYYRGQQYAESSGTGKLIFYGEFHGTCKGAPDGLYFVDERSFAFCSNGVKTIQPCAEGSANPSLSSFQHGQYYGFVDFCSVNLVANGYNGYPEEPAAVYPRDNYVEDSYEEQSYS